MEKFDEIINSINLFRKNKISLKELSSRYTKEEFSSVIQYFFREFKHDPVEREKFVMLFSVLTSAKSL